MQLFIANPSRQVLDFQYRKLEAQGVIRQTVPIGGQVRIAGILSTEDIDYIVGQNRKYGLVSAADLDGQKTFVHMCYSVDKPVSAVRIERAMALNQFVLVERGKKQRQEAAIAESLAMEKSILESGRPERLTGFEATIVEHNHDDRSPSAPVAEGIRVSREANPDGSMKTAGKTRGRPRKAA